LILLRPSRPTFPDDATEAETEMVAAHFAHLNRALNDGQLLLAGRTLATSPLGIAVLRMPGYEAAKAFLDSDPAIVGGVFVGELHPFRVALMHQFIAAQREMEAMAERHRQGM
jgi:uncharacterized protein YciI